MAVVGKLARFVPRGPLVWNRTPLTSLCGFPIIQQEWLSLGHSRNIPSKSPRSFCTTRPLLYVDREASQREAKPQNIQNNNKNNDNNPELPAFSLEGLGISRNMKLVIIGILCAFGTMETWMYCKWIWRWWKGEANGDQAGKSASS